MCDGFDLTTWLSIFLKIQSNDLCWFPNVFYIFDQRSYTEPILILLQAKNDHWSKFLVMLSHYYGPSYNRYGSVRWMCDCYAHLLVHRCNSTLSRFDAHWRTMIPKLVMHYACCYKSQVKTYVFPKCASVPSWKYKLPCHATYTYRYSCFQ